MSFFKKSPKKEPAQENPIGSPETRKKRFVLGEQDVAMREAIADGSGYIAVNPGALKLLKENNIDSFLIYEQAVVKQMEEKVDRFDFVQMDVNAVFREWSGKPSDGVPIPVRLVLWMKENAASHGYEQDGNSWVLKN